MTNTETLPFTVYSSKFAGAIPVALLVITIVLLGGALIYRSKRVSGEVSIWLVSGIALALAMVIAVWVKVGNLKHSVTIYPDRVIVASGVIPMRTITGLHIQSDVLIGRLAGMPTQHSHRILIADTTEGTKVVASDEWFDIEEIQSRIRAISMQKNTYN